jgi:hypothetical protein
MIEGKCPKCGYYRLGWALLNPRHQTCPRCGTGLEITEDGRKLATGYSPFSADRYFTEVADDVKTADEEEAEARSDKGNDQETAT